MGRSLYASACSSPSYDAANIVAEMDGLLRSREAAEPVEGPSADDIFNRPQNKLTEDYITGRFG